jgi:hypothetical protein
VQKIGAPLRRNARSRSGLRCVGGSGGRCGLVQNAMVNSEQGQLKPVRDSDFVINVAQIILDYLLGRPELRGDLLVFCSLEQ